MQKLAVALTTQEEFNEYMKYAEKMWRKRRAWNIPMEYWSREDFWPSTYMFFWDGFYYVTKDEWYKIISLQEAIGEKENKEIIREGEARGFEPKTGDWVMVSDYDNNYVKELYIATNNNSDYKYICVVERDREAYKAAENFESRAWKFIKPCGESIQKDRKQRVIESIEPYLGMKKEDVLWDNVIREAIEKHMPRISKDEVWEIERWDSRVGTKYVHVPQLLDLLRSKWLLE